MIEYFASEEGFNILVLDLDKTVVLIVDGKEITLSRENANLIVDLIHECSALDGEFFYH